MRPGVGEVAVTKGNCEKGRVRPNSVWKGGGGARRHGGETEKSSGKQEGIRPRQKGGGEVHQS